MNIVRLSNVKSINFCINSVYEFNLLGLGGLSLRRYEDILDYRLNAFHPLYVLFISGAFVLELVFGFCLVSNHQYFYAFVSLASAVLWQWFFNQFQSSFQMLVLNSE